MRVAMISTPFVSVPPVDYGGTELVVHELAEGLRVRGHDVTIFATGDSAPRAGLRALYRTAQWPPEILADINHVSWALERIAADGSYDLAHAHSAVALACGRFVPELPLVYTLHHARQEDLSAFYRFFPTATYVAVSEHQRRREVPLRYAEVIHHGLDPARYQQRPSAGNYVAFLGRLSHEKGPHTAIDAAAVAGVPIVMAGGVHSPDEAWAEHELAHRLRQPHVTYLGRVGDAVKVPLLRDARALLAPIEWEEPFGLALIEAMLSGCPVIAFARGSVSELVEPGVTGFIVESVEEMARHIRPGGAVDAFDRHACRLRAVERFSREQMVVQHERLYQRVLARRRSVEGDSRRHVA